MQDAANADRAADAQERFQALVRATADAVYRMSADWREMRQLSGKESFLDVVPEPTHWLDHYIPAEEQSRVMKAVNEAIRGKRMFELEHRVRRADGSTGWTVSRAVPVFDADGEVVEWVGVANDVTARRHAEENLIEMAARQAFLLRLNDEMRTLTDPVEIQYEVAHTLGAALAVDRVAYGEVDGGLEHIQFGPNHTAPGVAPVTGRFRMAQFGPSLRQAIMAGRTIVVADLEQDPQLMAEQRATYRELGIAALVGVPLHKGGRLEAVLAVHHESPREWRQDEVRLIEDTAERLWAASQRARAERELRAAHAQLEERVRQRTRELERLNDSLVGEMGRRQRAEQSRRDLLRQLVNAQEQERRRISRELHDQLGQELSALGLKLAILKGRESLPADVRAELAHLAQLARRADGDLDYLVWQLRPTVLDDLGLEAALGDFLQAWSSHFGIAATFDASLAERLPPEVETVLYRVAQEALNNVAKHARASRVGVSLQAGPGEVTIAVYDDGVGFDATHAFAEERRVGLVGMRERAQLVGGAFHVQSTPGEGTLVTVRVPIG